MILRNMRDFDIYWNAKIKKKGLSRAFEVQFFVYISRTHCYSLESSFSFPTRRTLSTDSLRNCIFMNARSAVTEK